MSKPLTKKQRRVKGAIHSFIFFLFTSLLMFFVWKGIETIWCKDNKTPSDPITISEPKDSSDDNDKNINPEKGKLIISDSTNTGHIPRDPITTFDNHIKAKPIDSDGDGVLNNNDKCPFEQGLPRHDGCPDKDNDNIPDKKDDCPNRRSNTRTNNGCPVYTFEGQVTDITTEKEIYGLKILCCDTSVITDEKGYKIIFATTSEKIDHIKIRWLTKDSYKSGFIYVTLKENTYEYTQNITLPY